MRRGAGPNLFSKAAGCSFCFGWRGFLRVVIGERDKGVRFSEVAETIDSPVSIRDVEVEDLLSANLPICERETKRFENFELRSGFLDIDMARQQMELDLEMLPSSTTTDCNILRRSSSAPLISGLGVNSQVFQTDMLRTRRNSTSFMSRPCLEESMGLINRETIYEREVQAAIQINQFGEENLNLSDNNLEISSSPNHTNFIPVPPLSSPSRGIEKRCFCPSLQTLLSCNSLPPNPIPSPTLQFTT
ncbi:P2R1A-PPP2R2A-interacting phosphatase regulator 1 isoform X1 [Loxodonta africana]|uniref:P2R1A-PPP2R2A-interacting phosphatase regulator 1 isoform X1 n=1 Tax=Loxodonta africana TaxID=9785 RepID=UPI0030D0D30B